MDYLTLFVYCSCRSKAEIADLLTEYIYNEQDEALLEGEIDRSTVKETLHKTFDIASTRMLKSLVEIGYMKPLYKKEEFDKLRQSYEKICEQILKEIFGISQTIDEEEFSQKLSGYRFL